MSKKATEFQRKEIEENKVDTGCAVFPTWISCPLPAAFSDSPTWGVIAGYLMQTVMRLSRYGAEFGNKKSPHNNLNLTIPSGMALVRVRYVAI